MDAEFVEYVLSLVITMTSTYALLRYDEMRLTEEQLERAWPASSRNAAVLAFSPFCLLVHFTRTRRSLLGVLLGVGAALVVLGLDVLVASGVEALAPS